MYEINGVDIRDIIILASNIMFLVYVIWVYHYTRKIHYIHVKVNRELIKLGEEQNEIIRNQRTRVNDELQKNANLRDTISVLSKQTTLYRTEVERLRKTLNSKMKSLDIQYHRIARIKKNLLKLDKNTLQVLGLSYLFKKKLWK